MLAHLVNLYRTAVTVANQQQDSEVTALTAVITLANQTLVSLMNATIAANYTAQLSTLDSDNVSPPSLLATFLSLLCR